MKAIGIDLGTTNSVAAVVKGVRAEVLLTQSGESFMPSVVSLCRRRHSSEGELVVGRAAVNNLQRDPANTVLSIKRLMGLVYGDDRVQQALAQGIYRLADPPDDKDSDQGVCVLIGDKSYTPVEVSAMILRQIVDNAETALGTRPTHAVITVPAYFEERQRNATAEAARLAGLEVLKIIDEPTAAAIAFGLGKEDEQHQAMVFDLGGGTFDISLIQMAGEKSNTLAIEGDNWLGGDDFDRTIVCRIVDWVKQEFDYDPSNDQTFLAKAKDEAQRAKIALSHQQSYNIYAPLLKIPEQGIVDVDVTIDRKDFESDISEMVDRTIKLVQTALRSQELVPEDISEVLLVGGSTAVPVWSKISAAR